jgi:hypothetical protein
MFGKTQSGNPSIRCNLDVAFRDKSGRCPWCNGNVIWAVDFDGCDSSTDDPEESINKLTEELLAIATRRGHHRQLYAVVDDSFSDARWPFATISVKLLSEQETTNAIADGVNLFVNHQHVCKDKYDGPKEVG